MKKRKGRHVKSKIGLVLIVIVILVVMFFVGQRFSITGEVKGVGGGGRPGGGGDTGDGTAKAQCSDGLDNDGDGFCDFQWKRASCSDGTSPGDTDCTSKDDDDEGGGGAVQVTTSSGDKEDLGISGDVIVWEDSWHIYMNDLSTGRTKKITKGKIRYRDPNVDGGYIVYWGSSDGIHSVYRYEIATGRETRMGQGFSPNIGGDVIVWVSDNGNALRKLEISTGKASNIATYGTIVGRPFVFGNIVVFEKDEGVYYPRDKSVNANIYMRDLSTGVETQISTHDRGDWNPITDGRYIVWEEFRYPYKLYKYDISTGLVVALTTGGSSQRGASISGDNVVFADGRNANPINNFY